MPAFRVKIVPRAHKDVQEGIDYYNTQQKGLGRKFHREIKSSIASIKKNPFFQIRYDEVRCLPVNKFPFMIHFTVNEDKNTVTIYAIINTSLDPNTCWIK